MREHIMMTINEYTQRASRARLLTMLLSAFVLYSGVALAQSGLRDNDSARRAYYRDYAIISTSCTTWEDAHATVRAIVKNGGVVSVMLSPQCFLGWVPDSVVDEVKQAHSILGISKAPSMQKNKRDTSPGTLVAAGLEHYRNMKSGIGEHTGAGAQGAPGPACLTRSESDPVGSFLDRYTTISDSTARLLGRPASTWNTPTRKDSLPRLLGIPPGYMDGFLNVDVFFLEKDASWTDAEIETSLSGIMEGFDFWSRMAPLYNRSVTFTVNAITPSQVNSVRVSLEPYDVPQPDDWKLIRELMVQHGYTRPYGKVNTALAVFTMGISLADDLAYSFDHFGEGPEKEFIRVMKYNEWRASSTGSKQSFCLFMKRRPNGATSARHQAYAEVRSWGHGDGGTYNSKFGIFISSEMCIAPWIVAYYPEDAAPAFAHETGHVFGCPDEYPAPGGGDCPIPGYSFRGALNVNCAGKNPTTSAEAIMRTVNPFVLLNKRMSSATPVHIGWINGPPSTVTFGSVPDGGRVFLDVDCEQDADGFKGMRSFHLGRGYRGKATARESAFISPKKYYFEYWTINGVRVPGVGPTLDFEITESSVDYIAHYSESGSGVFAENSSLQARLFGGSTTDSKSWTRSIILVWQSTLIAQDQHYEIEYLQGASWTPLSGVSMYADNARYIAYQIDNVPSGALLPGGTYTFRVVPFGGTGTRGLPSNEALVTLRPAAPIEATYGYDANEPNDDLNHATSIVTTSSTPAKDIQSAMSYSKSPVIFLPDALDMDMYIVTVSGTSISPVQLDIFVRDGSLCTPHITVQKLPSGTVDELPTVRPRPGEKHVFNYTIFEDADYKITVDARRGTTDRYLNRATGEGYWGEYTLSVYRGIARRQYGNGCLNCNRVDLNDPSSGNQEYPILSGSAKGLLQVFTSAGYTSLVPGTVKISVVPEAGSRFVKWEGFYKGTANPAIIAINPATDPHGVRSISPRYEALPAGIIEAVVHIPQAYEPFLGGTRRYQGTAGSDIDIELPEALLSGFDFLGWEGEISDADVVYPSVWRASRSIRVKLNHHISIRPLLRPRPCAAGGIAPFLETLRFITAKQVTATVTCGMQPGASDSLESGQVELPPVPVSGAMDVRFTNIANAPNGCITDIRGMQPSFTFRGTAQPGDNGNPVTFSWDSISPGVSGTFFFTIQGETVDMRSVRSVTLDIGVSSRFEILVQADTCRMLPPGELLVHLTDVDASAFPRVRGKVRLTDKAGNLILTPIPPDVQVFQKLQGKRHPGYVSSFYRADDSFMIDAILDDNFPRDAEHKDRGVVVNITSRDPLGEGEDASDFTLPVPDTGGDTTNWNGKSNQSYAVIHEAGWQLVSLPIAVTDARVKAVFADGNVNSPLFGFNPTAGYEELQSLEFGKGYWLKFAAAGQSMANGLERTVLDIKNLPGVGQAASNGWNLIGGLSYDVPVSAVVVKPAGALLSIFEYANSYKAATTMKPGKGYWVKLQPSAILHLVKSFTGPVRGASKLASETPYEQVLASLPHSREWTITDANGAVATLFATPEKSLYTLGPWVYEATELPPVPPSGAFDARCANGSVFAADADEVELLVQGAFPMTVAMTGGEAEYRVSMSAGTDLGRLGAGGTMLAPAPGDGSTAARLVLRKERSDNAPQPSFSISPAFPNPLHASRSQSARIEYHVAEEATVELTVYDALGRNVKTLLRGMHRPGVYVASWDATDAVGNAVPAGTYLYELRAGSIRLVNHLAIVR